METPTNAHLAKVEVAVTVGARPPLDTLMLVEVCLAALTASGELHGTIALPVSFVIIIVVVIILGGCA